MECKYDHEYKVQTVKPKKIGGVKELGISEGTINTWLKEAWAGKFDIGKYSHTSTSALRMSEGIIMLC